MKLIVGLLVVALAAQPMAGEAFTRVQDETERALKIEEREIRPDGPRTEADLSYETKVLGAFRAQQGGQGPLDGAWHVLGADGAVLYTLQLTDPGAGETRIEGAWRNPRATGAAASGFIDAIWRDDQDVVLSFQDTPAGPPTQLRLRPAANGGWSGERVVGEARAGIIANRAQGVETASMAVPVWTAPPPPKAVPKAKAKSKSRSKSKAKSRRRR